MSRANLNARTVEYATRKLRQCIRGARECSKNWRETRDRRFLTVRDEAMQDARYWRDMAKAHA